MLVGVVAGGIVSIVFGFFIAEYNRCQLDENLKLTCESLAPRWMWASVAVWVAWSMLAVKLWTLLELVKAVTYNTKRRK